MKILDVPQSGSLAGQTSSRNRYGQYRRTRAIPVNPSSSFQQSVRTRLQDNSVAWRALTDTQRAGWASLGASMVRTDSLGQTYTLTGFQAYCSVNNNNVAAGQSVVSAAPALTIPDAVTLGTITLTTASFTVAFAETPLGASEQLFVYASPQRSAGRTFEGDYRLIQVGSQAGTSPEDIFSAYEARLGTPVTDNRVFVSIARFAAGFLSVPDVGSQVVS